jgi:hypothetical protein
MLLVREGDQSCFRVMAKHNLAIATAVTPLYHLCERHLSVR